MTTAPLSYRNLVRLMIAILLVIPLTGADLYLGSGWTGIIPIEATILSFILMSGLFALSVLRAAYEDGGRRLIALYGRTMAVLAGAGLLIVSSLVATFYPGTYWGDSFRHVLLPFYSFLILVFSIGVADHPAMRRGVGIAFNLGLVVAAATIFIDAIHPGTFSTFANRSSGFVQNANQGSRIVLLMLIGALNWRQFRWTDLMKLLWAGAAVLLTLSRSGLVLFAIVLIIYSYAIISHSPWDSRRRYSMAATAGAIVAFIAVPSIISYLSQQDVFERAVYNRFAFFGDLLSGDLDPVAADPRAKLLPLYFRLIGESPIWGYGAGFSRTQIQPPHNIYLNQWVNEGALGLISVLIFYFAVLLLSRRYRSWQGICLALYCMAAAMISHSILYDRAFVISIGLLTATAAAAAIPPRPAVQRLRQRVAGWPAREARPAGAWRALPADHLPPKLEG